MKSRQKIYLILLTLLLVGKIHSFNLGTKFNLVPKFLFQKDSTLLDLYKKSDSLFKKKQYSLALKISLDVLESAKKGNDIELISDTNYLIGQICFESKSYNMAISYFKSSLKDFVEIIEVNDSLKLDNEASKLDENYTYLENNYNLGKTYHRIFEKLEEKDSIKERFYKDSIKYYYNTVINSTSIKKDIDLLKSKAYNNLSGLYIRDSLFSLAEDYALKSLEIKKRSGNQYLLATAYNTLSNIHFFKNEFEKSKSALFKGLDALEKIKGDKADEIKAGLYFNLAYSMYMLKDYQAYKYQELSWNLSDELNAKFNEKKIAEIYATKNFETGMKEGILQEEIKLMKQKEKTWFVTVLSISILIVLIGTVAYFKFRQKNLSLKMSRNELIQQQKIEKLKSESQIRILNATIDGKESERKQIAETLHDSVSTLLSSANLHLQACRSQFNGSTPLEIEKSQKIITEASDKIRDLSHTLVSSVLLKFGLQYSLKDMADKYSNSQIEIKTDISDLRRYDQSFEIKTYNIIQEFINNILKHSKATKAELTLFEKDQKLVLAISDNGQGFDKNLIPEKDGLGINQIDARIKMMQGKFTIESSKGNGTNIEVELPIHEREAVTLA